MMKWFRKTPSTADISMLRVELAKAQMRITDLQYTITELKLDNDILYTRIVRFLDEVELGASQDDLWDAIEILRGQR